MGASSFIDRPGGRAYLCADVGEGGGALATTAVVAEILIIGLEVEAWLVLALLSVFGSEWIELDVVRDFATLLTLVVLALAYVLGIVVDRLADTLLDRFEDTRRGDRIKNWMSKEPRAEKTGLARKRMTVMAASEGMASFLDYQRSRWRVARATVLNVAIAGPIAALYLVVGTDVAWQWALLALACWVVLVPTTYFAGVRIQDAWVARLEDAYEIVQATAQK